MQRAQSEKLIFTSLRDFLSLIDVFNAQREAGGTRPNSLAVKFLRVEQKVMGGSPFVSVINNHQGFGLNHQ